MNRIKQLRQQKNMKQEELANLLNVQPSIISKYETEKVMLNSDTLNKLSEIFEVSIDYILCKSNISKLQNEKATNEKENQSKTLEQLILQSSGLSEESQKDLLKQIEMLKMRDFMRKYNKEASEELKPRLN